MSIKKKLFAAAAAASLLTAVSVGTASADGFTNTSTPGFTITGGTGPRFDTAVAGGTTFPTVGNFNNVTLNGSPQLTSASIAPFTVIDDSGLGAGWHVTLTLPDFTTGVGGDVVSATGAQMNAPVVAAGNSTSPMGGVWSNPQGRLHDGQDDRRRRPGGRGPQRWSALRLRRHHARRRHGYLPGLAADPEVGRPGERGCRGLQHDGDHCHRERALIAD